MFVKCRLCCIPSLRVFGDEGGIETKDSHTPTTRKAASISIDAAIEILGSSLVCSRNNQMKKAQCLQTCVQNPGPRNWLHAGYGLLFV